MKIAVLTSLHKPVTRNAKGGTEYFTYTLVEGLINRGHEVTLFASSDSQTRAKLVGLMDSGKSNENVSGVPMFIPFQLQLIEKAESMQGDFDIIHNSFYEDYMLLPFLRFFKTKVVTTVHNDFFRSESFRQFFNVYGKQTVFVFVSESSRQWLTGDGVNSEVVYNGIDLSEYTYDEYPQTRFLWLSRVSPAKGVKDALIAAKAAGVYLTVSGVVSSDAAKSFFEKEIQPLFDDKRQFVGPSEHHEKIELYKNSKAFIFPTNWEEPFGLVMIEAMACGTPVIAYAKGAVSEVVKDGETGYIVNSSENDRRGDFIIKKCGVEGLVEAINRINSLSVQDYTTMRRNARRRVEELFSAQKMIKGYETIYQRLASCV